MIRFVFYKGFLKSKVFFCHLVGVSQLVVVGIMCTMFKYAGLPIPIVAVSAAVSHYQYGYKDKWVDCNVHSLFDLLYVIFL